MNVTTLDAYALEQGIGKTYAEMSKAEQVGLAYQMFLDKTSQYAGNYAKENETFAGSLNTLKGAFGNFMSGAGDIEDVAESFIKFAEISVDSIEEMAPKIVDGIVTLVNTIAGQLPELLQSLLPVIIQGVIDLLTGLIEAFPQIVTMLAQMLPTIIQQLATGLITIVNALAGMLPTLIPTIINAILKIIPILLQNLPLFINAGIQLVMGLITGLINSIPILIEMLPEIIDALINGLMEAIPQIIAMAPEIIVALAVGLVSAIPTLVAAIPEIIASLIGAFGAAVGQMAEVGLNMIKGLWDGIKNSIGWLMDNIGNFCGGVIDGVMGFFGINSPSKVFAEIGDYNMQGLDVGMEKGAAEVQSSFDNMFNLSPQLLGSTANNFSPNMSNTIVVNQTQDPLGQMVNDVKTFSGGSKNDYNYGMGQ